MLNLFGESALSRSIDILREFEPPEGYFLAFSGGKDSIVLYNVAKISGVKFKAYYSPTTIDPPEVVRFIRREYPDVIWTKPPKLRNFFSGIEMKGLPTITRRWCCEEFKEYAGRGQKVALGVRAAESRKRARYPIASFDTNTRKWRVLPIHHWSNNDVWEFIMGEGLKYPSLYDEGFYRIGCILCPFNSAEEWNKAIARWPAYFARAKKCSERFMINRGKNKDDAERYWEWWFIKRPLRVRTITTCQLLLLSP